MSEPSTDHSVGMATGRLNRHVGPRLEWSTIGPIRAGREATRQVSSPEQAPLKILFANKFFFLNGGSEVVMFDEMELMRKYALDVIEFSMHDPRNFPIEVRILFRLAKGLPVELAK